MEPILGIWYLKPLMKGPPYLILRGRHLRVLSLGIFLGSELDNSTTRIKALTRGFDIKDFDADNPLVSPISKLIFFSDIDQYHITLSNQLEVCELLFIPGTSSTATRFVGGDGIERTVVPIRIASPNSIEVKLSLKYRLKMTPCCLRYVYEKLDGS